LLVREFVLVPQSCSPAFVAFDDAAVADYFDTQVDLGRQPAEFGRIWLHTHPGISAQPSPVDEATFQRVFGDCQWSVMFILARGGATYARLQGACGLPISQALAVEIDFAQPFAGSDQEAWEAEYLRCVRPRTHTRFFNEIEPPPRHLAGQWEDLRDWPADEELEFRITPEFFEES